MMGRIPQQQNKTNGREYGGGRYIVAETSGMERKVVTLWVATTQRKRDDIVIFFLFRARREEYNTLCVC